MKQMEVRCGWGEQSICVYNIIRKNSEKDFLKNGMSPRQELSMHINPLTNQRQAPFFKPPKYLLPIENGLGICCESHLLKRALILFLRVGQVGHPHAFLVLEPVLKLLQLFVGLLELVVLWRKLKILLTRPVSQIRNTCKWKPWQYQMYHTNWTLPFHKLFNRLDYKENVTDSKLVNLLWTFNTKVISTEKECGN